MTSTDAQQSDSHIWITDVIPVSWKQILTGEDSDREDAI
eukprot:COSAG06_NODE_733_length_12701_cov_11.508967_3_plen_39_part_00